MILAFKPYLVDPILQGTKIHTLREDPHNRWKPGNSIQMATGVRTRKYNCFKEGECISVQKIKLINNHTSMMAIIDDGYVFHQNVIMQIAKNDGFSDPYEFMDFFFGDQSKNFGEKTLKIIHWTDFKYTYESMRHITHAKLAAHSSQNQTL